MIIALCGLENQTQSLIASLKSPSPIFFFFFLLVTEASLYLHLWNPF